MAKEPIILSWCDPCAANDVKEAAEREVRVAIDGQEKVLDLCEAHDKEFIQPLQALHADWGQTIDAPKKLAVSSADKPRNLPATCPICRQQFASRVTAIVHMSAGKYGHGVSKVEASKMVPVNGTAVVCACGFVTSAIGMSRHGGSCDAYLAAAKKVNK